MKTSRLGYFTLLYKNSIRETWHIHGFYNKTDALGTANNLLKMGSIIQIEPVTCKEVTNEINRKVSK